MAVFSIARKSKQNILLSQIFLTLSANNILMEAAKEEDIATTCTLNLSQCLLKKIYLAKCILNTRSIERKSHNPTAIVTIGGKFKEEQKEGKKDIDLSLEIESGRRNRKKDPDPGNENTRTKTKRRKKIKKRKDLIPHHLIRIPDHFSLQGKKFRKSDCKILHQI